MPNYAVVENGQIRETYDVVPTAWKNVSGLNRLSDEDLVAHGWYKIQKQPASFDTATHRASYSYAYDSSIDAVVESVEVSPKPEPVLEEAKGPFLSFLRELRNQRLVESDFTQLADVIARSTPEKNQAWSDYRQALRDLPSQYVDNDVINIERVEWPSKPE